MRWVTRQSQDICAGLNVPDRGGEIAASDRKASAVRAKGQRIGEFAPCRGHLSSTVLILIQARAVPKFHPAVLARAREIATVGAEGQIKNISIMFSHNADFPASLGVPDFQLLVLTCRDAAPPWGVLSDPKEDSAET